MIIGALHSGQSSLVSCTSYYEVPIEVPISAKLDLSKFQRVLVASFATVSSEPMDLDAETVRLLRNQLRTRSRLTIVEAASKALRTDKYGEVRWAVLVTNQNEEPVASYELLTMNTL